MSYSTQYQCANDYALRGRIAACCSGEGDATPDETATELRWPIASASDIAAAYEAAVLNENPNPGGDPAVITDQMILSAVQAHRPTS